MDTVQIGLETEIIASDRDVLAFSSIDSTLFKNFLRLENSNHYPGKSFALFDTVHTSVVEDLNPQNVLEFIQQQGNFSIINVNNQGSLYELIIKKEDRFIYRVIIPEKIKQQSIIVDYSNSDSSLVTTYFQEGKISQLIR